ncbi:MAG: hypothetical protein D6E12_15725 [Desulfovibrio sp.]|nr:MAG: hypothetical protein D6E12_15725 [Desulfovibrio sp.]
MALPALLDTHLLDDEHFAQAYDGVTPEQRAWLKTSIAFLHAAKEWGGPHRSVRTSEYSGATLVEVERMSRWAVVLMGRDVISPVRVVACASAARLAGVEEVVAVVLDEQPGEASPLPDPVLAGLELAGVESVALLSPDQVSQLMAEAVDQGEPGVVLALGELAGAFSAALGQARHCLKIWREPEMLPLAAWGRASWNWDALEFAHPGAEFVVYGEAGDAPGHVRRAGESLEEMIRNPHTAVYLEQQDMEQALASTDRVLGPGCESVWFWPELSRDFFIHTGRAWARSRPEGE